MMAQKHLHELLKEDQEPFLLKKYISDRRSQLKVHSHKTILQVKKQKPIIHQKIQNSSFPVNLCKNACFLSLQNTPDIRKSPLFEFKSPEKSPCRSSNNTIFIHIPARTASLLLEASLRIQKQSKTKTHNKNNGFGLLGSFFKRLTSRSRSRNREIEGNNNNNNNVKVSVKDILRWDSSVGRRKLSNGRGKEQENKDVIVAASEVCSCEVGFTCSYNGSAVWSETNEDKSMDMETSTSGHSYDSAEEETQFPEKQKENDECACFDDHGFFCESPFRFVLQRNPSSSSSGRRTPEFSSPAPSPSRNRTEDKESNGDDSHNKFQSGEEEEEKEQCSPVSVLDPPFGNDDDDVHENDDDDDDEDGGFDLECSYANVQRTKQQLLERLSRFEKLAELDPIELEKRMLDQEDEYETFIEEDDSETSCEEEKAMREIVFEILCQSSVHDRKQVPEELKRLVYDLIMEEDSSEDRDMVIRRVCGRLELWKEVESNTIDMMIEEDLSREESGWKKNDVKTRDLVGELELAIFGFLVEEFSEELVC